jgi:hypothetical protein
MFNFAKHARNVLMLNKTISLNNVEAEIEEHEGAKNLMTVERNCDQ